MTIHDRIRDGCLLLTCGLVLGTSFSFMEILFEWDMWYHCTHPLHLYLLVDFATIVLLRCFQNVILYVFFIAWTITGTIWFADSAKCNTDRPFLLWLVLSYAWIVLFMCFACERRIRLAGGRPLLGVGQVCMCVRMCSVHIRVDAFSSLFVRM